MVVTDWGAMNDRLEGFAAGCDLNMPGGSAYMEKAALAAGKAGTLPERFESEGFDRESMEMPEGHLRMIEAVSRANPNTVVVLLCGGVPVADAVKGILYMGLPGQAGGEAIAHLLCGRANPCGRLAESWPMRTCRPLASSARRETRSPWRTCIWAIAITRRRVCRCAGPSATG